MSVPLPSSRLSGSCNSAGGSSQERELAAAPSVWGERRGLGEHGSRRFASAASRACAAGGGNRAPSWNTGCAAGKLWLQQPRVRADPREGVPVGKVASGCGEAHRTEGQGEACLPPRGPRLVLPGARSPGTCRRGCPSGEQVLPVFLLQHRCSHEESAAKLTPSCRAGPGEQGRVLEAAKDSAGRSDRCGPLPDL